MRFSLKPGYAFKCSEGGFDYNDIPNDWWETVVVSKPVCDRCGDVGERMIDGTLCVVFIDDYDGTHYAQTKTMARDS